MTRHWLAAYTKARHESAVARQLEAKAVAHLLPTYPWPENIREMRNVLERAAQLAQHKVLTVRELELQHPETSVPIAAAKPTTAAAVDTRLTIRQMETRYIELVLAEEAGSIDRAAKRLGISRSSLYSKIKTKDVERIVM